MFYNIDIHALFQYVKADGGLTGGLFWIIVLDVVLVVILVLECLQVFLKRTIWISFSKPSRLLGSLVFFVSCFKTSDAAFRFTSGQLVFEHSPGSGFSYYCLIPLVFGCIGMILGQTGIIISHFARPKLISQKSIIDIKKPEFGVET